MKKYIYTYKGKKVRQMLQRNIIKQIRLKYRFHVSIKKKNFAQQEQEIKKKTFKYVRTRVREYATFTIFDS